jgi:hypothetical protein
VRDLADSTAPRSKRTGRKVLRRVAGYNLDIFHPQSEKPYTADGSVNLAHLLVGSEGTLALHAQPDAAAGAAAARTRCWASSTSTTLPRGDGQRRSTSSSWAPPRWSWSTAR